MLCCTALVFLIGLMRAPGRWLGGEAALFAPLTRVPGPDEEQPARPAVAAVSANRRRMFAPGPFLLGLGIGVLSHADLTLVLLATGVLRGEDSGAAWWWRDGLVLLIAVVTAGGALRMACLGDASGPVSAGWVIAGAGAGMWMLGYLDLHLLGVVGLSQDSPVLELVFHGPGVLVLSLGAVVGWARRGARARSA